MSKLDVRWRQRFSNYQKALSRLETAVSLARERDLSELEEQGLIQAFEFTHELARKVLKDYFEYQGNAGINGSRDATREGFKYGIIQDGESWMEMIISRNKSSHTYNEAVAREIAEKVVGTYFSLFQQLANKMEELQSKSF